MDDSSRDLVRIRSSLSRLSGWSALPYTLLQRMFLPAFGCLEATGYIMLSLTNRSIKFVGLFELATFLLRSVGRS